VFLNKEKYILLCKNAPAYGNTGAVDDAVIVGLAPEAGS
jgi:hypothetical protein